MAEESTSEPRRVIVKLRGSSSLRVAESRANLTPLYDGVPTSLTLSPEPQWFEAELASGAPTAWDLAHERVADQLGISASEVLFVEPDVIHDVYRHGSLEPSGAPFSVGETCNSNPQDPSDGKGVGPELGWHLNQDFSQLAQARSAVSFADPRTRIAHLDTGYYPRHESLPAHVQRQLERNFVDGKSPTNATDPDNRAFLIDNSGHGTGTLGILAGSAVPPFVAALGGAPGAEIVPLRLADSVVLLRTSAFAKALNYAVSAQCDVASMSMGGLPSKLWREAVDAAYEAGLCLVAAAGNNFQGAPTRHVVYPARYSRVIAVCGVMANQRPYADLHGFGTMEGNYGPTSVMGSAMAAYTPNIPWPRFGCPNAVDLDGAGTSSATPQVAATVALWFEKYKAELPRNWRRIEAVRHALFSTADKRGGAEKLGQGMLRANAALNVRPMLGLQRSKSDNDSFAFLRVLTGLGLVDPPPREEMYNLELSQLWLTNQRLIELVPDPQAHGELDGPKLKQVMEAVIEDPKASLALRRHLVSRYPVVAGSPAPPTPAATDVVKPILRAFRELPQLSSPAYRRLRVYAVDPSLSGRFEYAGLNEVTLKIRWEPEEKRAAIKTPSEPPQIPLASEYLEFLDTDASGQDYPIVNLNHPSLLAQDGWAPSEGNPQFHQQMVYAVAMKTIEHFEVALGRPVLWRPKSENHDGFRQKLIVQPHRLAQANAFYSPEQGALLFGYFEPNSTAANDIVPNTRIYTCLSHDIIAHETTHAILDGMYRRFNQPSNPDVLAFHEAFADIVALMQHFTFPEILEDQIGRTRGNLETESILGSLALQFGTALAGGRSGLREAIGTFVDGKWQRLAPNPVELQKRLTPHARGAILVAAVFDVFLAIYRRRSADLLRIYTGGSGVLPAGALHPDLVQRLADEASKSARHVLTMCIRALDYLPPVDVTFFEFLRALITADYDFYLEDPHHYRVAFVEAFRQRGIYPVDLNTPDEGTPRTLSVDTLRWQGLERLSEEQNAKLEAAQTPLVDELKRFADACFYIKNRARLHEETWNYRQRLTQQLATLRDDPELAKCFGVDISLPFEVHELRRSLRVSPDGTYSPHIIAALTQTKIIPANPADNTPEYTFTGGSTLILNLSEPRIEYVILKDIQSASRQQRTAAFVRNAASDPLRNLCLGLHQHEPFAALHALSSDAS